MSVVRNFITNSFLRAGRCWCSGTVVRLKCLTAAVAAGIVLLTGCQAVFFPERLQTTRTVTGTITFPAYESAATITWIDAGNHLQTLQLPLGTTSIALELPACTATPVLIAKSESEHPIGCVFPTDSHCTVAGGWSAHILYQFLWKTRPTGSTPVTGIPLPPDMFTVPEVRQYADCFNWSRLTAAAERVEDPWQFDEERILTAICNGTFDTSLVTRPKSR